MSAEREASVLRENLTKQTPSWGELRASVDHSDKAYEYLNSAPYNGDPQVVKSMIEAATVHAKLALADKLEELIATIKLATTTIVDSQAKLIWAASKSARSTGAHSDSSRSASSSSGSTRTPRGLSE